MHISILFPLIPFLNKIRSLSLSIQIYEIFLCFVFHVLCWFFFIATLILSFLRHNFFFSLSIFNYVLPILPLFDFVPPLISDIVIGLRNSA
jgi:hypothetical protein